VELEFVFAIGIGLISLAAALMRASRIIRDARGKMEKVQGLKAAQAERIRKEAKVALALRREVKRAELRHGAALEENSRLQELIQKEAAIDRRVYVLDDRRTPTDRTWLAVVVNPDVLRVANSKAPADAVESWRTGRRFVVWALDERKAREKLLLRMPERQGYHIRMIRERVPPGPAKASDKKPTSAPASSST
jgi:hypothetical protein